MTGPTAVPSTQQGYSPFSTWTRGLAWVLCAVLPRSWSFLPAARNRSSRQAGGKSGVLTLFLETAKAVADFYVQNTSDRRHPVLGYRCARDWSASGIILSVRQIRSTILSPSTAPRRRSPRKDFSGLEDISRRQGDEGGARMLFPGGPHDCAHSLLRAISLNPAGSPGIASAFCLPSSERMGLCPAGQACALG